MQDRLYFTRKYLLKMTINIVESTFLFSIATSYRATSLSIDNVADIGSMDTKLFARPKGDFRLCTSSENIYRKGARDRTTSGRSDDAAGVKKSHERLIEGIASETGQVNSGTRTPGLKDGQSRSVFSSFIDGVRNLASRLSEKAGLL